MAGVLAALLALLARLSLPVAQAADVAVVTGSNDYELQWPYSVGIDFLGGPVITVDSPVYLYFYGNWPRFGDRWLVSAFIQSLQKKHAMGKFKSVYNWWQIATRQIVDRYSVGHGPLTQQDLYNALIAKFDSGHFPFELGAFYVVMTSPDIEVDNLCTTCGGHFLGTYINVTDNNYYGVEFINVGLGSPSCRGACIPNTTASGSPRIVTTSARGNPALDAMIGRLSQLLVQTATDPLVGQSWGKYGPSGFEGVADLCNGIYSGPSSSIDVKVGVNSWGTFNYNLVGAYSRLFLLPALWDPLLGSCQIQALTPPGHPPPSPPPPPTPPPPPSPPNFQCFGSPALPGSECCSPYPGYSGFVPDYSDSSCRTFCTCINGTDIDHVQCPLGTTFDTLIGACNPLDGIVNTCPRQYGY
eukprot:SM000025S08445  [mRNA]  locus=s25:781952:784296:+ [translate_table: standard]